MKKPFVIHPFLFAIFPILFLFSHNIEQVSFSKTLVPMAVALGFTLLLSLLSRLILRDNRKAGIIVSIFLILFFSHGHVYNIIQGWQIGILIGRHGYLLFTWGMLFTCGAYFTVKTRRHLHNLTNILNAVAAVLVAISVINIVPYKLKTIFASHEIKSTKKIEMSATDLKNTDKLPDVYYIILDRYAASSTLKEIYNFDNSEFTDYLSNKGFYVAFESRANYLTTFQSLASSLNMEYINYLSEKVGEESNDWKPIYTMVEDYKVWRFLKSKGYKFIHFGSWADPTRRNEYADMNFALYPLSDFSRVLYKTTMLWPIGRSLGIGRPEGECKKVLRNFDKLAEISNIKEPTFTFAHILLPHFPYLFDRNGNVLTTEEANKRSRIVNYVDQLIFTNKKVKVLIDNLLSSSEAPPIIILQSDEGPHPSGQSTHLEQMSKAELRQKMRILNAYYLPNADKSVLYPSISPVNSFRLVFNLYFRTNFELLPDESYAFVDENHIYKFFNVTDKVKYD